MSIAAGSRANLAERPTRGAWARLSPLVIVLCALLLSGAAWGAEEGPRLGLSGLALPRFLSLNSDRANVRTGPGVRYPIAWVFVRRDMPLEVIAEFELWRKVRDIDGAEGWIHKSLLSGRRSAIVTGEIRTVRRDPGEAAAPVLFAEPGVQGWLLGCRPQWCRVRIAGRSGWLPRAHIWGVHPWEVFE